MLTKIKKIESKEIIDKDQYWFWTKKWQEEEKEAENDIRNGKVKKINVIDALIAKNLFNNPKTKIITSGKLKRQLKV